MVYASALNLVTVEDIVEFNQTIARVQEVCGDARSFPAAGMQFAHMLLELVARIVENAPYFQCLSHGCMGSAAHHHPTTYVASVYLSELHVGPPEVDSTQTVAVGTRACPS